MVSAMIYVVCGVGALMFTFIGLIIGRVAIVQPYRIKGTMRVLNLSNCDHGGDPEYCAITYKARLGWYSHPVESPCESGKVWVQIRHGPFGMLKRYEAWDKNDILPLGEKRRAWAIYKPSILSAALQQRMDQLINENGVLAEQLAEARLELSLKMRDFDSQVDDRVEKTTKMVKEITPMPMQRRTTGGGGQR